MFILLNNGSVAVFKRFQGSPYTCITSRHHCSSSTAFFLRYVCDNVIQMIRKQFALQKFKNSVLTAVECCDILCMHVYPAGYALYVPVCMGMLCSK